MLIKFKFHIIYIVVIHIKHVRYSYTQLLCVLTNDELLYNILYSYKTYNVHYIIITITKLFLACNTPLRVDV